MATDEWLTRKEVSQREKIPEATAEARASDEAPGYVQTFERQRPRLPSSILLTCEAEPFRNRGSNSCWER